MWFDDDDDGLPNAAFTESELSAGIHNLARGCRIEENWWQYERFWSFRDASEWAKQVPGRSIKRDTLVGFRGTEPREKQPVIETDPLFYDKLEQSLGKLSPRLGEAIASCATVEGVFFSDTDFLKEIARRTDAEISELSDEIRKLNDYVQYQLNHLRPSTDINSGVSLRYAILEAKKRVLRRASDLTFEELLNRDDEAPFA